MIVGEHSRPATPARPRPPEPTGPLRFLWCEVSRKCQLSCSHCYAESSPAGTHGAMTTADWERVIGQAAGLGVELVQFIGGEPTLRSDLAHLIRHARGTGMEVEVF